MLMLLVQGSHFENHGCGYRGTPYSYQRTEESFSMRTAVLDLKHVSGGDSKVQTGVCLQRNAGLPQ